MKILIVEDDFTSRIVLQELLKSYGDVYLAVNGREGLEAYEEAADSGEPYELIFLDIMMPEMDGQTLLKRIREKETTAGIVKGQGVKVVMTTALDDPKNVMQAYFELCNAYLTKPIRKEVLRETLDKLGIEG